jgi:hypothetical protein
MFKLSKSKNLNSKHPIARVHGGVDDKKYLYIEPFVFSIDHCKPDVIKNLSDEQKRDLEISLKSGLEPDDEKLTEIFYTCKEDIKNKSMKIQLKGGGKLETLPDPKCVEKVGVFGISGSGKSYYSARFIKNILRMNKEGNFFILSNVLEDEPLDKLQPIRLDNYETACDGIPIEDIENSVILFDDIATINDRGTRKGIEALRDDLLECGRHYNTRLVCTAHLIMNGWESRRLLNECTSVVLFPRSNRKNIINYLKTYEKFTDADIMRAVNLPSRWFCLVKQKNPQYIIHEKGAYIV